MVDRAKPTLSGEELAWLSVEPPQDEQGRRVAWTLGDRRIHEVRWTTAIEHEQLTLARLELSATQWERPSFSRCRFSEVRFSRTSFVHARFEDVVFERCSFDESTFDRCVLERCRFEGCELRFVTGLRTRLSACVLSNLRAQVFELREAELLGTRFVGGTLEGLRLSKCSADTLEFAELELRGADLTACPITTLRLSEATVEGLRVLDCRCQAIELSAGKLDALSMSGTQVDRLELAKVELLGPRVLESRFGELRLDACPVVASLVLAESSVGRLVSEGSVLYDASFEQVEVATGRLAGGSLAGLLFRGGRWAALELVGARLDDYLTVIATRFEQLRLTGVQVDAALRVRLEGDSYGAASMTWGDARGS